MEYFFHKNGKNYGPISMDKIAEYVKKRIITEETLLRQNLPNEKWFKASKFSDLFFDGTEALENEGDDHEEFSQFNYNCDFISPLGIFFIILGLILNLSLTIVAGIGSGKPEAALMTFSLTLWFPLIPFLIVQIRYQKSLQKWKMLFDESAGGNKFTALFSTKTNCKYWENISKSQPSFIFHNDGGFYRSDGVGGSYKYFPHSGYLYLFFHGRSQPIFLNVISIDKNDLVLGVDKITAKYKKGSHEGNELLKQEATERLDKALKFTSETVNGLAGIALGAAGTAIGLAGTALGAAAAIGASAAKSNGDPDKGTKQLIELEKERNKILKESKPSKCTWCQGGRSGKNICSICNGTGTVYGR